MKKNSRIDLTYSFYNDSTTISVSFQWTIIKPKNRMFMVLLDFSLTVKAAPYACVIRTGQP